ncbi:MAG: type IV pilus modification PilV family protein [Thermoanaerobaculia bacterium]
MPRERGFSLVELLMAILVLTIVITTTLAIFTERTRRMRQASDMLLAYQVLANESELERRVPFATVDSATAFSSDLTLIKPLEPYTTAIDVTSPRTGIKEVTMTITWNKGQREAKLAITRADTGGGNFW